MILVAVLSLAVCCKIHAVEVIRDGKIVFKGVVIAEKPTSSAKHAAREIAYHLKKSTGQEIPVISDREEIRDGLYFYMGDCRQNREIDTANLPKNTGMIWVQANGIHIAGKDASRNYWEENNSTGTLFATYEFLEKYLGVRWLWPGELGEVVPTCRELDIPKMRIESKPKLLSSLWRDNSFQVNDGWNLPQNRKRFLNEQKEWLKRHRFSCHSAFQHFHAFTGYWQQYGKEHPEYFSLLPDGTRRPNPYDWSKGNSKCVSLCVTNPGLIRTIIDNWARREPRIDTINLNENDTAGECVCPACLAADNSPESSEKRLAKAKKKFELKEIEWENELGSLSDRYCQFYLTVQKEADKIDPNHRIMGLIYANFSKPPTDKIKLNDRIVLRFCPPYMYPWTDKKIQGYKETWGGWAKTGAGLMFRPNFTLDGSYFPIQYQDVFYDLYTFSAKNGMMAADMDSLTGHFSVQGLVNYVIATLNHDRDTSLIEQENTFFSAFGAAKPQVKEYFDYIKQVSMKSGFKSPFKDNSIEGGLLFLDLFLVADTLFTPEVMKKCTSILDEAARVPNLDPVSARRVEFLRNGLKNTELTMTAQAEFRKYKSGATIDKFAVAVAELDGFRNSIEHTNALNMGNIRYQEDRHWPNRAALKIVGADSEQLTNWKFLFDPENRGLAEQWFSDSFDRSGTSAITTDSHWNSQPPGKEWVQKHGTQYLGTAWYFTQFDLRPANSSSKSNPDPKIFFQAIDGAATIYLNGQQIHHRPYPFEGNYNSWKTPFQIELPAQLLKPKENHLAIRIEKHDGQAGIWRPAHIFYGPL